MVEVTASYQITEKAKEHPRTEYGFTGNHILKPSGADCTAFHGSLFSVVLPMHSAPDENQKGHIHTQ